MVEGENFNVAEAEAIVQTFMVHHRAILALAAGRPDIHDLDLRRHLHLMAETVAFISPYRRQTKLDRLREGSPLKSRLEGLYAPHLPERAEIRYEGFLPNLMLATLKAELGGCDEYVVSAVESTVFGTVHALQGAERPLVFLSCVAGEKTGFFNREAALVNVAVTRAKSHLVIARSVEFARNDPPGTPARLIAATMTRSRVLMPRKVLVVESRDKGRPIARAGGALCKVVATRGSIGQVTSLDRSGNPLVEIIPSAPHVAADLEALNRWIRPEDEGGFGVRSLVIATDADEEGEVIANDLVDMLRLSDTEIRRRGLTVTRWPLKDPATLGLELLKEIDAARRLTPRITGRWRAVRQRARTELRAAVGRAIAGELRRNNPARYPSLPALRAMRLLQDAERPTWEIHVTLLDELGQSNEARLSRSPGVPMRFEVEADAAAMLSRLLESPALECQTVAVPSPIRTRRSLYDVLAALSWADIPPLRAMKVLQRLFEIDPRKLS